MKKAILVVPFGLMVVIGVYFFVETNHDKDEPLDTTEVENAQKQQVARMSDPDTDSPVAVEPTGVVRPSEQFAEIVARGWPRTALLGTPPHAPNPADGQAIISSILGIRRDKFSCLRKSKMGEQLTSSSKIG